jgi:hypothetical protein
VSYFRANGRFSGRICSGGGRLCVDGKGGYTLGDVATTASGAGFSTEISGDPVIALVAQVNRFAGKSLKLGAATQMPVKTTYPLASVLTDAVATAAVMLVYDRYQYAPLDFYSAAKAKWANSGLSDSIGFVSQNLRELVVTLAEYGDSLNLPPASVGVTKRVLPQGKLDFRLLAVAGGLMALAFVVAGRK